MTDRAREVVDGYLGPGWYNEWRQMERSATREIARLTAHAQHFHRVPKWGEIYHQAELLSGVRHDYKRAMELIARGKQLERAQVGRVHDIYTLALGAVEAENNALDVLVAIGVAAVFTALPILMIQNRAKDLKRRLNTLVAELKRAERDVTEAYVQTALNVAVVGAHLMLPHMALFVRLGIFAGQFVWDVALGPPKSVTKKAGAVGAHGAAAFEHEVTALRKFGRTGTGAIGGLAFAFDVDEVLSGYKRQNQVKAGLEAANRSYKSLMLMLNRHMAQFKRLDKAWKQYQAGKQEGASEIIKARDADMRRFRYTAPGRKVWAEASSG